MGRVRGGSGRGGGSGRSKISRIGKGSHAGIGKYDTYSKEKENSRISKALGNSMFTLEGKNSADVMRTTWEKVVQHIGISLYQDISTELRTRALILIPAPTHSQEIL